MNEHAHLLGEGRADAVVAIHHSATPVNLEVGSCSFDRVKTTTVCERCRTWICKAHQHTTVYFGEPVEETFTFFPCMDVQRAHKSFYGPVCEGCWVVQSQPAGYPRFKINIGKSIGAGIFCAVVTAIVIFAAAHS